MPAAACQTCFNITRHLREVFYIRWVVEEGKMENQSDHDG